MDKIELCGVQFTPIAVDRLHQYIGHIIHQNGHDLILNVNVHAINLAQQDLHFRSILNTAPLVFCDGFGVRLGALLLGYQVPPRITYADWMWQLSEFAEESQFTLFLLGSKPGISERAASVLLAKFPKLQISGTHHGYFDKSLDSIENQQIVAKINEANPDILIVCFGMPLQEYWLANNWQHLNARIGLAGGAALDYLSGDLKRGPRWMIDYGFEWLARLLVEPSRLWKRYIIGNPRFLWRVLRQRVGLWQEPQD
jgi:N-acetylglucosaminyldiphosphoundecaprenol N-acetyl-beta-D-mannosaminyltransferase